MGENAPFGVVSVNTVIFKVSDVKQEYSVLLLMLLLKICLLHFCLQVACALQECSKCMSKTRTVQCLITSLWFCYK